MSHDAHRLVTATELWLESAEVHGVRYSAAGKSFEEVANDYYRAGHAYRERTGSERGDQALTASERMAINVAYARTLMIEGAIVGRGGVLNPFVDPIEVINPSGWAVPRTPVPHTDSGWESTAPPAAAPEPLPAPHDAPTATRGWWP